MKPPTHAAVWTATALALLAAAPLRGESPTEPVGRAAGGRSVTPVNQVVSPAGRQVELPGLRPQVLALSPDGRLLVTSGKTNEVVVIDPATAAVRQRVKPPADDATKPPADAETARNLKPDTKAIESYTGLVFAPDGSRLYMSNVHGSVKVFSATADGLAASHTIPLPPASAPQRKQEIPAGLAVSSDGTRLFVCGNLSDRLLEIDTATGETLRTLDVGVAPFDVELAAGKAI
ncbi:MAG: YncE family protein [Planctomycetia bacterium]